MAEHGVPDRVHRRVMSAAMSAELLDADTERDLARAWRDRQDETALHRLVSAYLRLAVAMAARYRRYGVPMGDLTQEAGVGLMKAASKFDPDRGVRFSTYAVWWIRAALQDLVMRDWSLVRTGSTSSQKTLFFNLRRVRARIERENGLDGDSNAPTTSRREVLERVAEEMGLPLRDVEMMEMRLSGQDFSLNAQQAGEEGREWVETLEDDGERPEEATVRRADSARARAWLADAMTALTERERMIIRERRLVDEPKTLESLGVTLGLSKERVRQLEAQALKKMRRVLEGRLGDEAAELASGWAA